MNAVLDAFWRSVAYCLHPKVILWSFLPLVLMVGVTAGLGYFYLDSLLSQVNLLLEWWKDAFESGYTVSR